MKTFEHAADLKKLEKQVLNNYHCYYINVINNHRYVQGTSFTTNRWQKVIDNKEDQYFYVVENLGNYENKRLYYKTKEYAQEILDYIIKEEHESK